MRSHDSGQMYLFSSLCVGREGVQCERSIRALSYVFHGWAHFKGPRKALEDGKPDGGALPIISFEKLGSFWCRLWKQLWDLEHRKEKDGIVTIPSVTSDIRFPPPFIIERAKHGKRPQRHDGINKPIPLAELLHQQQEELGIRYFDIRPFADGEKPDPNHYKTLVHPTLPEPLDDRILEGFSEIETDCLKDLSRVLRHLGATQIRALGTHENFLETFSDIKFEFDNIADYADQVSSEIENGQTFYAASLEMLEYAEEAYRKSFLNRKDYEAAYDRFRDYAENELIKKAFDKCQHTASHIWDPKSMRELAAYSEHALSVARCLTSIGYFADHVDEREQPRSMKSKEMLHLWEDGIRALINIQELKIPAKLTDIYSGKGPEIKPQVQAPLLEMLAPFSGGKQRRSAYGESKFCLQQDPGRS